MTITTADELEEQQDGQDHQGRRVAGYNKTSPFEFYQYLAQRGRCDVLKCIRNADLPAAG